MTVTFSPATLRGTVDLPPSKSESHRALICAALSRGTSHLGALSECDDCVHTLRALVSLGARVDRVGDVFSVTGTDLARATPTGPLDCGESASTLRFLLPFAALVPGGLTFGGSGRLLQRSLASFASFAKEAGLRLERAENTVSVHGRLSGGRYAPACSDSSQTLSGLLMALPLCEDDSLLCPAGQTVSRPYVSMTREMLRRFGIRTEARGDGFFIWGRQDYRACDLTIEKDADAAALWSLANVLGSSVVFGGQPFAADGAPDVPALIRLLVGQAAEIDLTDIPDAGPCLFAEAAVCRGGTFRGISRLRDKESDRVAAMDAELSALGAEFSYPDEDTAVIVPGHLSAPARPLSGHRDHRIVTALSLLLSVVGGSLTDAECVKKSYPGFFPDLQRLGGRFSLSDR